jgi:hypothetical protein
MKLVVLPVFDLNNINIYYIKMPKNEQRDLTILTVKDPELPDPIDQDPRLPNVTAGAAVLDVAKPRAGKTVRIVNLLLNPNFFLDAFDEVFIFSATMSKGDHSSRHLFDRYKSTIYNEYSDEKLQNILDFLDSIPKDRKGRYALIFDDFIQFPRLTPNSLMFKIASSYRHYLNGGLLYYSTQQLKKVPPVVRASVNYVILSANSNLKQVDSLSEEFGNIYGKEKFLELYARATGIPYGFAYLDLYGYTGNNDHRPKFYSNFTTLLYEAPLAHAATGELDLPEPEEEDDEN